jgi:Zn-dependent peptidase ImmA (M78 family)
MAGELGFTLFGDSALGSREAGWARAVLSLDGEPYWADEDDGPFDWTWIEMLDWLARNWSALVLEEGWPLPLPRVRHPGDLLPQARERWRDLSQTQVDLEQTMVYRYLDRHNLARSIRGAFVPALTIARSGNTMWLVDEDQQPSRVAFSAAYLLLEQIGQQLAHFFAVSQVPHVQATVAAWHDRENGLRRHCLSYRTGLDHDRLTRLGSVPLSLIEPPAQDFDPVKPESAYLAAARMARHVLTSSQIGALIMRIHNAMRGGTPISPRLATHAQTALGSLRDGKPWEQGYRLAQWLRAELKLDPSQRFDPMQLMHDYDVSVISATLETPAIDAIACWGESAPLVMINTHAEARSSTMHGQRSTLAHELCHLLIDRDRALPVAEVLGGEVDVECEQRANAFAAEILLPQALAARRWSAAASPGSALAELCVSHGVSRQLAAQHLLNTTSSNLTEDDRILLERALLRNRTTVDTAGTQ